MIEKLQQTVLDQAKSLNQEKQKIKDNQAKYYRLLNAIHEVYYSANAEGFVTEISPSIGTVAGYDCQDIIGSLVTKFYKHPEDRESFLQQLSEKGFVTDYELSLVHKDGYDVMVSANAHIIFDENHKPCRVEGMLRDITERVALEKQLQALNEQLEQRVRERTSELETKNLQLRKFSQAIDQAAEGFIITDCSGTIEYVNRAFEKTNGYTADEIIGQSTNILNSGTHPPEFFSHLWNTLEAGKSWEGTIINKRKSGHEYPALMTIVPIQHNGHIDFYAAIQQDMSEHEKLQTQFQQAQKMEAIGTLAGGMAHDFNNMLSGILMNLYLAKKNIGQQDKVLENITQAEQMGFQGAEILKSLMIFSRNKEAVEQQDIELNSMLKDSLQLLRISIPNHVNIQLDICQDSLTVKANMTQLQQVLINLLNNARDALSENSQARLSLSLNKVHLDQAGEQKQDQPYAAKISICDNGCGIEPEALQRVFEPFYTSKSAGHGTGLGLAMVYGCIEAHHGTIEVESKLGEGTCFHIYLPLSC